MNQPSHLDTALSVMDQSFPQNSQPYRHNPPTRSDSNFSDSFSDTGETACSGASPMSPGSPTGCPCPGPVARRAVSISAEVPNVDLYRSRDPKRDSAALKENLAQTAPESVELLRQGRIASCQGAAVVVSPRTTCSQRPAGTYHSASAFPYCIGCPLCWCRGFDHRYRDIDKSHIGWSGLSPTATSHILCCADSQRQHDIHFTTPHRQARAFAI